MTQRIFRVFISSTFSDYAEERQVLHAEVFPKLSALAAEHGLTFEAVDLRWGIPEAAQTAHSTLEVCLSEIRRCKALSPSPNFIAMVGNRYGWEPPRASISEAEMASLFEVATDSEILQLKSYYRCDTNALPNPIWHLKPVSFWSAEQSDDAVLELVRKLATSSDLDDDTKQLFFLSATHHEIREGLLGEGNDSEKVCVYFRHITDLEDLADGNDFRDANLENHLTEHPALGQLRNSIRELPIKPSISDFKVDWQVPEERAEYLRTFAEKVYEDLGGLIQKQLLELKSERGNFFDEGDLKARERAQFCFERDEEIAQVIEATELALKGLAPRVIFIDGASAVGKTQIVSKLKQELDQQFSHLQSVCTFVEHTSGAENLSQVIADFEIVSGVNADSATTSSEKISAILAQSKNELILLLDGIDKFAADFETVENSYLPVDDLSRGVIIVSADSAYLDAPIRCAHQRIQVSPFNSDRAAVVLTNLLRTENRKLTDLQSNQMSAGLPNESTGLYLQLLSNQLRDLASWEIYPQFPLSEAGLIARLTAMLSSDAKHGETLVRRSLAYLSASRQGLSEQEIQEALGLDKLVIAEFYERAKQTWSVDEAGILPPIIWSRLRADLDSYLSEKVVDGTLVMDFRYPKMKAAFRKRYVSILRNMDYVTHGALMYVFRPPLRQDNWRLFAARSAQDPRILRSIHETKYHKDYLAMDNDLIAIRSNEFGFEDGLFNLGDSIGNLFNWITANMDSANRIDQFLRYNPFEFVWSLPDFLACQLIQLAHTQRLTSNSWFDASLGHVAPVEIVARTLAELIQGGPTKLDINLDEAFATDKAEEARRLLNLYDRICDGASPKQFELTEFVSTFSLLATEDNFWASAQPFVIELAKLIDVGDFEKAIHLLEVNASTSEFMAVTKCFFHAAQFQRLQHLLRQSSGASDRIIEQICEHDQQMRQLRTVLAVGSNPNSIGLAAFAYGRHPSGFDLALESISAGGISAIDLVIGETLDAGEFFVAENLLDGAQLHGYLPAEEALMDVYYRQLAWSIDVKAPSLVSKFFNERYIRQVSKCVKLGSAIAHANQAVHANVNGNVRESLYLLFEAFGRGYMPAEEDISQIIENRLGLWSMNSHWIMRRARLAQRRGSHTDKFEAMIEETNEILNRQAKYYPPNSSAISLRLGYQSTEDDEPASVTHDMVNTLSRLWDQDPWREFQLDDSVDTGRHFLERIAAEGETWAMIDLARFAMEADEFVTAQAWIDLAADYYDSAGIPFLISHLIGLNESSLIDRYMGKWALSSQTQQSYLDSQAWNAALQSTPAENRMEYINYFITDSELAEYVFAETLKGIEFRFTRESTQARKSDDD